MPKSLIRIVSLLLSLGLVLDPLPAASFQVPSVNASFYCGQSAFSMEAIVQPSGIFLHATYRAVTSRLTNWFRDWTSGPGSNTLDWLPVGGGDFMNEVAWPEQPSASKSPLSRGNLFSRALRRISPGSSPRFARTGNVFIPEPPVPTGFYGHMLWFIVHVYVIGRDYEVTNSEFVSLREVCGFKSSQAQANLTQKILTAMGLLVRFKVHSDSRSYHYRLSPLFLEAWKRNPSVLLRLLELDPLRETSSSLSESYQVSHYGYDLLIQKVLKEATKSTPYVDAQSQKFSAEHSSDIRIRHAPTVDLLLARIREAIGTHPSPFPDVTQNLSKSLQTAA